MRDRVKHWMSVSCVGVGAFVMGLAWDKGTALEWVVLGGLAVLYGLYVGAE